MAELKGVNLVIAVDFDGTIVEHEYPKVGAPVPWAVEILTRLVEAGHNIILHTMRHDSELTDAVEYMKKIGIPLYGVNENPKQKEWTQSPKAYAHIYIDDAAVGCPLIYLPNKRPYVDWIQVEKIFVTETNIL